MTDYTTADEYPVVKEFDEDLPSGAHVRLRRPSMFLMLRRGQLPPEAREIVGRMEAGEDVTEAEQFTLLDCLVAASYVHPKVNFKRKKGALCIEDVPDDDRMAIIKRLSLRDVV